MKSLQFGHNINIRKIKYYIHNERMNGGLVVH